MMPKIRGQTFLPLSAGTSLIGQPSRTEFTVSHIFCLCSWSVLCHLFWWHSSVEPAGLWKAVERLEDIAWLYWRSPAPGFVSTCPAMGDFCFQLMDCFAFGACVIGPKHRTKAVRTFSRPQHLGHAG